MKKTLSDKSAENNIHKSIFYVINTHVICNSTIVVIRLDCEKSFGGLLAICIEGI